MQRAEERKRIIEEYHRQRAGLEEIDDRAKERRRIIERYNKQKQDTPEMKSTDSHIFNIWY